MPKRVKMHRLLAAEFAKKDYDRQRGSAAKRGYGSAAWERLRREVFLRDLYTCRLCGRVTAKPHCDHIIERKKGGADDIDNLRTLCHSCHSRITHTKKDQP